MGVVLWERLKELDAYPKPLEDFRIKTLGGGTVTVISTILMVILFIVELSDYLTPTVTEELFVDTSRSHKLKIHIDLIFPRVACSYLSIDAMDSSGEQQSSIEHSIFKQRLDPDGMPIMNAEPEKTSLSHSDIGKTPEEKKSEQDKKSQSSSSDTALAINDTAVECGSCYGAETPILKCCNTCEQVREAYRLKGWALGDPAKITQCAHMVEEMKTIFNEGCEIFGEMEVNRVSGSFHVAPGKSFSVNHLHVHDVQVNIDDND